MATVPETIAVGIRLPWWRGMYLRGLVLWAKLNVLARREITIDPEAVAERIARGARFYTADKHGRKRWIK